MASEPTGGGPIDKALGTTGVFLDDRFRAAKATRTFLRKIFPDHWSFMLGEIALYSFVVLLLTGTFLTFFFKPSMGTVIYHGSYAKLHGIRMSEAYASTLNISFDVRGGLLMRQIHHWAADLFVAAIMAHMIRIFFTGAYRKPREFNWLIGIALFTIALFEGLFGYSLPDDQLSGAGLRVTEGIIQSIPVVGTYLAFFLFGGQFPGTLIVPRMYVIHILLFPAIILALITAHLFFMFHQKHTQMPGKGRTNHNVVGAPMYPYFMAKTGAFFFFVFGVAALFATFVQINPIWLYGPYNPVAISSGSQPDFYTGMLEGAMRAFPSWSWNVAGHTFAFNVFVPALGALGLLFTAAALWPFIERWILGDYSEHHINDRPRDAPTRTAIGMAVIAAYGVLWLEGANDVIADHLQIPLFLTTEIARWSFFILPVVAYIVTKRICLGLQRKDAHLLEHGVETGIIRQLPNGAYIEETRPVDDDGLAVLTARAETAPKALPAPQDDGTGVPDPATRRSMGRLRLRLNRVLTESIPLPAVDGHGNGHGNGHGEPEHAVAAGDQAQLPAGPGDGGPSEPA